MSEDYSSLSYLVHPVKVEKFKSEYWEEQPLLVQRESAHYYTGLLTHLDIERLLPLMRVAPEGLRIVRNGETLDLPSSVNEIDAVLAAYAEGATLILQALHKYWPPLTHLCNSLARELSCPFQVNAYLTPPAASEARGLSVHYDVHDVFVLQLVGSKHWRLYGSPIRLPLENDSFSRDSSGHGEPNSAFDLNPGDCVYIPRGYVHEALVRDSATASLHLTIGVQSLTWMHLIQAVVQVAGRHEDRLRASLPIGFARNDNQISVVTDRFEEMIRIISTDNYVRRAIEELADELLHQQRSTADQRLRDIEASAAISLRTLLCRNQGVVVQLNCRNERASLAFHGKEVSMPLAVAPALRFMVDRTTFCAAQLPGDLDDESKLVLVRRLVREGLLTLRREESTRGSITSESPGVDNSILNGRRDR